MAAQFKVGGKVVCIQDCTLTDDMGKRTISIKKGRVYFVEGVDTCRCGFISLNVGFVMQPVAGYVDVSFCGCGLVTETPIWWIDAAYFVPLEENEFRAVTYTKILEEIPQAAN